MKNKPGYAPVSHCTMFHEIKMSLSNEPVLSARYIVDSVEDGPLMSMPLRQFIYSLGSRSSAPGGGSASAAIAAMVSTGIHHHHHHRLSRSFSCQYRIAYE